MIVALPNRQEARTLGELRRRGFMTSTISSKRRILNIAHPAPSVNVVPLAKRSIVASIFDFARGPL